MRKMIRRRRKKREKERARGRRRRWVVDGEDKESAGYCMGG